MSVTVKAELTATTSLKKYLLRTLPAKVAAINITRAATLVAPYAGPYTVPANSYLSVDVNPGPLSSAITAGTRTATQVAANLTGISNMTASSDSQGRLTLTNSATIATVPITDGTLYLGPNELNSVFGWSKGGERVRVKPLVAPGYGGIRDGDRNVVDLEGGAFGIIFGEKKSSPTNKNIRYDETDVTIRLALYVPVHTEEDQYSEAAEQCVRAVRECIYEDRTLDSAVQFTDVSQGTVLGPAFKFNTGSSVSPLIARADMVVLIRVFERS